MKMSKGLSAKYYQENYQKRFWKILKSFYRRKKKKKRQYGYERYKNLSEDEEQELVKYRKNIIEWEKTLY